MKLNNLPPFYIGQKVVYITGISMPKNSIHIVTDIKKDCDNTYSIAINGAKYDYDTYICIDCKVEHRGKYMPNSSPFLTWEANSFRPLQEQKFPLISYTKVLEEVEVCEN